MVEPGVREQLRPHSGEVFCGDAADDGRGDRLVRTGVVYDTETTVRRGLTLIIKNVIINYDN